MAFRKVNCVMPLANTFFYNAGEPVAFTAYLDHTLTNVQDDQKIVFNQVISNEGDGYDQRVGIFTCPKTGLYLVSFFIGKTI